MDPLAVLREFCTGGRLGEVALEGGAVSFGSDFVFDAGAPTGYASARGAGQRYTAGSLAHFAASGFGRAGLGEYLRSARDAGVPAVAVHEPRVFADQDA